MRNRLFGIASALILGSTLAAHGCGDSGGGSTGSGGSSSGGSGKGGSSSGGAGSGGNSTGGATGGSTTSSGSGGSTSKPPICDSVSPCGGDLVGTWNVTSSCLSLSGDLDVSLASLGCATVPVTGSLKVTGSWTAKTGGSYTDSTKTTGSITFPLGTACLTVSSVKVECSKMASAFPPIGWAATCATNSSGDCMCSATADQSGGLGAVSAFADTSGTYTTSGSGLNLDEKLDFSYCVSGNQLTITPKAVPATGAIVFQKEGTSAGSGGATTGSGGKTGAGGATTGSGGATTGQGGKTGAGGAGSGGVTSGTGGGTVAAGGKTGSGGATGGGGATSAGGSTGKLPCDIYAAASTPCVTAHSTVRVLVSGYTGALYQVKRSDGTTKDIGSKDGFADSAAQDTFCTSACTIMRLYDQSGHGNFLAAETPDSTDMSPPGYRGQSAASATGESLNVGGRKVYSLYTKASQAYWHDGSKSGMPLGKEPQGVYMVANGTRAATSTGCCYDYGNSETSRTYVPGPTMDSVYFGACTIWGHGAGSGPWIMADMEDGMVIGNSNTPSITWKYVTAIEKNNGTTQWALRGGDATTGKLTNLYSGALPPGKNPMKKEGAIVLGSGGDCCYSNNNASFGTFYEGAIVAGYPSDATEDAIQENIVSVGYGK